MLTPADREVLLRDLPPLRQKYPKFLVNRGIVETYNHPPRNPDDCIFSTMSVNYTADMKTRVEPCIFGGNPDCSQCGCAISVALEWVKHRKVAGPITVGHLVRSSVKVGKMVSRLKPEHRAALRWERDLSVPVAAPDTLVQIGSEQSQPKSAAGD